MAFRYGSDLVYRSPHVECRFELDLAGITRYAVESRELGKALHNLAELTTRYAASISPYDAADSAPHYRDQWDNHPYLETRVGGPPLGTMPRQAQIVTNQSDHAILVEFGNGRGTSEEQIYGHRIFPKIFDFLAARP